MLMDVVYPYRAAPEDLELRFSLRSLANVPHRNVIVSGDWPEFSSPALRHIRTDQHSDRYQDSTRNILAAAEQGHLTDEFIVMHDDIFILEPWTFRHEHLCTLREYLASGRSAGDYRERAQSTRELLTAHGVEEPIWYGLHTPTVYDRDKLVDLIHEFEGRAYLLRTLYHNLHPAPSERAQDVKLRGGWNNKVPAHLLSASDGLAIETGFRDWLMKRFPDRSRYEHRADGKCLILGYAQTVWDEAYAAMGPFEAIIASPEAAAHENAPGWRWGALSAVGTTDDHCLHLAWSLGFDADQIAFCGRQPSNTKERVSA